MDFKIDMRFLAFVEIASCEQRARRKTEKNNLKYYTYETCPKSNINNTSTALLIIHITFSFGSFGTVIIAHLIVNTFC